MLTPDVCEFVLRAADATRLPDWTAGAHISVATPSGAMRRYSLVGDDNDASRWRIAVKLEPHSRGGSASMHARLHVGDAVRVEAPVNDFQLADDPRPVLLIAGGIGITPIIAMARHLAATDRSFRVVYCARSRDSCAYAEEMEAVAGERLTLHLDDGQPDAFLDFWDWFATPTDEHVYCCGPAALMEEVKAVSGHWPDGRVHFESFQPVDVVRADDRAFALRLAASGRLLTVPKDRSILETVRAAGISVSSSCESGTCGTCRTRLLAGRADHRDQVLLADERDDHIMICVSRAAGDELVIDL